MGGGERVDEVVQTLGASSLWQGEDNGGELYWPGYLDVPVCVHMPSLASQAELVVEASWGKPE